MKKEIEYRVNENGCFICTSHRKMKGYPGFYRNGKHIRLCRYIYEVNNGKIPDGMMIRHTCDNRACINPAHLIVGTAKENYQDMVDRNRRVSPSINVCGQKNPMAKLKDEDVIKIKARLSAGDSQSVIARDYGVSRTRICEIAHGRAWCGPRTLIRG